MRLLRDVPNEIRYTRKKVRVTKYEKQVSALLKSQEIFHEVQAPFYKDGSFVLADIFIPYAKLVIEVDGKYHEEINQAWKDKERDMFFFKKGIRTVRIANKDVAALTGESLLALLKIDKVSKKMKRSTPNRRITKNAKVPKWKKILNARHEIIKQHPSYQRKP